MSEKAKSGCDACLKPEAIPEITMAFQPIVNPEERTIFAYEALVRGTDGSGAGKILAQIQQDNRYTFDQQCRIKAIELASKLGMKTRLSINFMPNAVYKPETCIRMTLEAAEKNSFLYKNIIFEATETERVEDTEHLLSIIADYKKRGFQTAIDDFGSGYAGLQFLVRFQPDIIKLDRELITDIQKDQMKRAILEGIKSTAQAMNITLIAEGIETREEYEYLRQNGISLFQGYYFARPAIEALPVPEWDQL